MDDWVGNDKITIGDINGSYAAIGAGASVIVNQAISYAQQLDQEIQYTQRALAASIQRKFNQYANLKTSDLLSSHQPEGPQSRRNPYKALLHYTITDTHLFYGRDQAISAVLECIQQANLTVLHAESGAGKTSLLEAGIAARILAGGHLPLLVRAHNRSPQVAIKQSLLPDIQTDRALEILNTKSLLGFLTSVYELFNHTTICILLDQFEEFFTQLHPTQQASFGQELADCLAEPALNVRWVLALRKEYFSDLQRLHTYGVKDPYANHYRLEPLTKAQALQAIVESARSKGLSYEASLAMRLVEDLEHSSSNDPARGATEDISPPHLQIVCAALVDELPLNQFVITHQIYASLGSVEGILRNQLQKVLEGKLEKYRTKTEWLLIALVSSDSRRIIRTESALLHELSTHGLTQDELALILRELLSSRLLSQDQENGEYTYELAHDYLVREITLRPEITAQKAAAELLHRELYNWVHFKALLRPETLRVINAQRDNLQTTEDERELLIRSAILHDLDTTAWLEVVTKDKARAILIDELCNPLAEVRTRAGRHLVNFTDREIVEKLQHVALTDLHSTVRETAFNSLSMIAPQQARLVLLAEISNLSVQRRLWAVERIADFMDDLTINKLAEVATQEQDEMVWHMALTTLVRHEALNRSTLRTRLLHIPFARQVAVLAVFKAQRIRPPLLFRLRSLPAQLIHNVNAHPFSTMILSLLLIALYISFAFWIGLPPFRRWDRYIRVPATEISNIGITPTRIYIGSFNHGIGFIDLQKGEAWSGWMHQGLPNGKPGILDDPTSIFLPITDLAINRANPAHLLIFSRGYGLLQSTDGGEIWRDLSITGQVNTSTEFNSSILGIDVAVHGSDLLVASDMDGLFNSHDSGKTWLRLDGSDLLPKSNFIMAEFDPTGHPYISTDTDTYIGTGSYPWQWSKVSALGTTYIDFGVGQDSVYMALGFPPNAVGCMDADGNLSDLVTFGSNIITALTATPFEDRVFYVAVLGGMVYEVSCDYGIRKSLGWEPLSRHVKDLEIFEGQNQLLMATGAGLYTRRP